jgi:lysyl-tRNA synthetase class II
VLSGENHKDIVRSGGRIVGRRKVSKDLLFLDVQSNGEQLQFMLDHVKL